MQKILFNDDYGLTEQVLKGQKTMTRRFCRPRKSKQLILADEVDSYRYEPIEHRAYFFMKDGSVKFMRPQYWEQEIVAVAQAYNQLYKNPNRAWNQIGVALEVAGGWNNKLFVSPKHMPHQIKIQKVDVEPLQNITCDHCLREGVQWYVDNWDRKFFYVKNVLDCYNSPIQAFKALINSRKVGGNRTWDDNPFVFVYEFKLVK